MKLLTRISCLLLLLFFDLSAALSQESVPVTFGKVTAKDFTLPETPLVDNATTAVVIADVGNVSFIGNKHYNWVSYVFKQYIRMKIIKRQAFHLATVQVSLHGSVNGPDMIDSLRASTYNLENGKVIETKLNMQDVFRDTISKNSTTVKFTLPDVKEGSIIEYSYTKISNRYRYLPYWNFQHRDYPCLFNKYEVAIPSMLGYLTLLHGSDSFVVNKLEKTKQVYEMSTVNVKAEVTKHTWVMKDIRPFSPEPFVNHPYNYMDAIEFHLLQTYNGEDVRGYTKWATANQELLEREYFGQAISLDGSSSLGNVIEKITTPHVGYMQTAKELYAYIRDNFTCIPGEATDVSDHLYNINKQKKGTPTDLNMLLVAMLRQKNINASPVILSTTDYGTNPASYPVLDKMNYVICMMRMGGDTVFLDASRRMLGFGKLPLECYNGHARVISDHDSGSIYLNRDDIREQKTTTVFISNDEKDKGKMSGTVEIMPGNFESYDIREKIKKIGQKVYFKDIQKSYSADLNIGNLGIDSLSNFDNPVKIHHDISFVLDKTQNIFYFTPIVSSSLKENPLKAASRKYPIEMDYPLDELYVLSMEIPDGYTIEEMPKSAKVSFGSDGSFEYLVQKGENNVQMKVHIKINKAEFAAEDYNSLREFFAYIAKKSAEPIVFRRKN